MKNLHVLERFLRAAVGAIALELALFWLATPWQIVAYLLGTVLLGTAAIGTCPLYSLLGVRTCRPGAKNPGKAVTATAAVVLVAIVCGGAYGSFTLTRKLFLEDFNAMSDSYKQTLFLTGKGEREKAITNYETLIRAYGRFQQKYSAYQPYVLRNDGQLKSDLVRAREIISGADDLVHKGDLHQAHLNLETVRPIFQELFKRNGFSMLSVALVDFHDAMEILLDAANAKNGQQLMALYPQVSEKLRAVEAESKDAEIQAIRQNLETLAQMAQGTNSSQLPTQGEALKSSFIKVYLKRG